MANLNQKRKHEPMRMCIVTRVRKPKNELIRIVRTKDGLKVDGKGKEKGRGANLEMKLEIFDDSIKKGLLSRALKLDRKIEKDEVDRLRNEFANLIEEREFRRDNKPVKIRVAKKDMQRIKDGN